MSEPTITVLVADDHAVVREGIRNVLGADHGFEIIAEAASASEALALAESKKPDVVLLDITMPGESGLSVASRIRQRAPRSKILVLSIHDSTHYVREAVRAGVHGYLLKDAAPVELRSAVKTVHRGEALFSPTIASRLSDALEEERVESETQRKLRLLTPREREVLKGVAEGYTNKELAARMEISHRTVETHRESIVRKLEIKSIAGLTRFALDAELVARETV